MYLQLEVWLQSMILLQIVGTITSYDFHSRGNLHHRRLKHHRWRQTENSDSSGSERHVYGSLQHYPKAEKNGISQSMPRRPRPHFQKRQVGMEWYWENIASSTMAAEPVNEDNLKDSEVPHQAIHNSAQHPEVGSVLNNGKKDEYELSFASDKYNVLGGTPINEPNWDAIEPNDNTNGVPGFVVPDNIPHPGFAPPNNNPPKKPGPGFGPDIKHQPPVIPKKEPVTTLISGISPNFNTGIRPGFGPGMGPGPVLGPGVPHGTGHQPPHFEWEHRPLNDQKKQNLAQFPVKEPPIFPANPAYQNKPALIPVNSQINYGPSPQRPVEWDQKVPNFPLPNQTPTRVPPNEPFKFSESNKNVNALHPSKIFPVNSGSVPIAPPFAHSPFSPHLKPDVPGMQTNTQLLRPKPKPQPQNSFQGHPSHVRPVSQHENHRKGFSPSPAFMTAAGDQHYEIDFGNKKPEEIPRVSENPLGPVRWTAEEQMTNQKFPVQQPSMVYSPWNPQESAQQDYVRPEGSVFEVSSKPETTLDESHFNPDNSNYGPAWNLQPLRQPPQQDDYDLPDNEYINLSSGSQNHDFYLQEEKRKRREESSVGHRFHLYFERLKKIFSSSTSVHLSVRNSLLGTLCAFCFLNNVLMKDLLVL